MHFHICIQPENWTLQKADQEYVVSSERKISAGPIMLKMRYYTVEVMNILHTIQRRKANWIGCILRRNFF